MPRLRAAQRSSAGSSAGSTRAAALLLLLMGVVCECSVVHNMQAMRVVQVIPGAARGLREPCVAPHNRSGTHARRAAAPQCVRKLLLSLFRRQTVIVCFSRPQGPPVPGRAGQTRWVVGVRAPATCRACACALYWGAWHVRWGGGSGAGALRHCSARPCCPLCHPAERSLRRSRSRRSRAAAGVVSQHGHDRRAGAAVQLQHTHVAGRGARRRRGSRCSGGGAAAAAAAADSAAAGSGVRSPACQVAV
jgi:hypothetical protein